MSLHFPTAEAFTQQFRSNKDWLQETAISILKKGKIPRHVGIILDGNRRFAKKLGATNTLTGHYEGYKRLTKALDLCIKLGMDEFSVYAFSLENFKRSKDEVDYLMQIFHRAFGLLCNDNDLIRDNQVRVRFLGKLECLSADLAKLMRDVMEDTKENTGLTFNICCPYTSRDEMTDSIKKNMQMVDEGLLDLNDVDQTTLKEHLLTSPLDILVRTSGEIRLSDFLLHQASEGCQIQFVDCFWPDFTIWQFLPILLEYQLYHDYMPGRSNYFK